MSENKLVHWTDYEDLSDYKKGAVKALMEAYGFTFEKDLAYVDAGLYKFYPDMTLKNLAYKFVHDDNYFGDPKDLGILLYCVDHTKLGKYLSSMTKSVHDDDRFVDPKDLEILLYCIDYTKLGKCLSKYEEYQQTKYGVVRSY